MSKNPQFVAQWSLTHFDPYKVDKDRALAERAAKRKADSKYQYKESPTSLVKDATRKITVHQTQTRRARVIQVTVPKLSWGKKDE
jgi:hypothetical protein